MPILDYYRPVLFLEGLLHVPISDYYRPVLFLEGLLHVPISDYYRPVLFFRESITHPFQITTGLFYL